MELNTWTDVTKAVDKIRKNKTGKNCHYPVMFKKALIEFSLNAGITAHVLAEKTGLASSSTHNWFKQHSEGLYQMDAAYAVSKKSKKLNHAILSDLKQKVVDMQEKIAFIEKAESMGFKISEA